MPKKVKEQEVEIDVSIKQKKKPFVVEWFDDYVVNNKEELKIICDLTSRSAEEQFCLYLKSGNTQVYAVIFYVTFMEILKFIESKQNQYNNFTFEICNSINVGYTNNSDEDNEKSGNFMPLMEYIGVNRNVVNDSSIIDIDKTSGNYIRWKELNVKKNIEYCKEIQEKAYNRLKTEYKTGLRSSESVIPLFCIFMDNISNLLKVKYSEIDPDKVSEVSMDVLGLFQAYYSFDSENNKEIIEFECKGPMKRFLKHDEKARRE